LYFNAPSGTGQDLRPRPRLEVTQSSGKTHESFAKRSEDAEHDEKMCGFAVISASKDAPRHCATPNVCELARTPMQPCRPLHT